MIVHSRGNMQKLFIRGMILGAVFGALILLFQSRDGYYEMVRTGELPASLRGWRPSTWGLPSSSAPHEDEENKHDPPEPTPNKNEAEKDEAEKDEAEKDEAEKDEPEKDAPEKDEPETTDKKPSPEMVHASSSKEEPKQRMIVATLSRDDNLWVYDELHDIIEPEGPLGTAMYVVDDQDAELHPPANKGHEAIVYLSYILDFYDRLPEVSIFMHGHGAAWHNNDLLNLSSSLMIRHLNHEKVVREGYMNLRCHWDPGCPDWLHPADLEVDHNKEEQMYFADAWRKMFPLMDVPETLSQPCCSQFAVSRDRLRELPRSRYVELRNWILNTNLEDEKSGRVFEYVWQVLFHNTTIYCPDPRICYCDGYSVCFETKADWDAYFDVQRKHGELHEEWDEWDRRKNLYEEQRNRPEDAEKDPEEEWIEEKPDPDRGDELLRQADEIEYEMTRRKNAAIALGSDPADRERILKKTYKDIEREKEEEEKEKKKQEEEERKKQEEDEKKAEDDRKKEDDDKKEEDEEKNKEEEEKNKPTSEMTDEEKLQMEQDLEDKDRERQKQAEKEEKEEIEREKTSRKETEEESD